MASFPTTAWTKADISNGATSDASDVNDIAHEVQAIEDGYLNGTARLNSSATTVNTLNVAGTSTFAGQVFAPRFACRVSHSASQNVEDNTLTGLSFNAETFDLAAMHSTGVNSSRLNLVSSGVWSISGCAEFGSTGGSKRQLRIRLNDTSDIAIVSVPPVADAVTVLTVQAFYRATSTSDYVTLMALQNAGSSMTITAGNHSPTFGAALVGY